MTIIQVYIDIQKCDRIVADEAFREVGEGVRT